MKTKTFRHSVIALMIAALALIQAPARSFAEEAVDTSKLPRVSGTKDIYASPQSTIFTSPATVADTAAETFKALNGDGWQRYERISAGTPLNSDMVIASLKKGAQGLSVFINAAPAQNNATTVTYSLIPLTNDLPFPKAASDIRFDPEKPHLMCVSADTVEAVSEFFRMELISRGWSPWSKEDEAKAAFADRKTPNGLYAYYVRDNQKPLILSLQKSDDGKTSVNLEAIPPELIVAAKKDAEPKPATTAPEAKPADKAPDAFDALANDIMKQVNRATADALADALGPTPKSDKPASPPQTVLAPLEGNTAPMPVPSSAENVAYDASAGSLEFNSASSVSEVVTFYRSTMPPLGWTERKTVIDQPNMVALEFHKGDQELAVTVMKMGTSVNVTASGSALENSTAASAESSQTAASGGNSEAAQTLEPDEAGGLPIPKPHTLIGSEKSMFRHGASGSIPAKLTAVIDFYRGELAKRGWQEDAAKANIKPDAAEFFYTTPEGPAVLKLGRANGETTIQLTVRETEAAKKSGLMPKPGQTKLLFGNILDSSASVVIAGKTVDVRGGAGSKAADGPMIEIAPGKYPYSLKGSKAPMANDTVEVAADEIWGLMIGTGGILAIQMY